jgi:hypothetical protein
MNKANFTAETMGDSKTGNSLMVSLDNNRAVVLGVDGLIAVLVVTSAWKGSRDQN